MRAAAMALAALLATGCAASIAPAGPKALPPGPSSGALRVGAAVADVTPPPGAATFGHGLEGRVAEGLWTRLHCRVFVLAVGEGAPFALVPCDLAAMSVLLHRAVADAVRDVPGLDASRLVLTATHTHAGPAHYFEGVDYGGLISTRRPGYDGAMTAFLAGQIAAAIHQAVNRMEPATARWGYDAALWNETRNRNLGPHRANPHERRFPFATAAQVGLTDERRAIDPRVQVLWLDDLDGCSLGSVSFYAMHPAVLPNTNRLWGADTHGITSRAVERQMRAANGEAPACRAKDLLPPHGIVNTNEGDLVATYSGGTMPEAERVGTVLAGRVWATRKDPTPPLRTLTLASRYLEVDLPSAPMLDGSRLDAGPLLGLGAPSGAREHTTVFAALAPEIFYEGNRDPGPDPKAVVLGLLQTLIGGRSGYPRHVPLTLAQIGDRSIAFVPAELTLAAGVQVARAVLAKREPGAELGRQVIVGGLANGYIQYVTTEEEYAFQRYEGASNLYGKWTTRLLAERFALLEDALLQPSVEPSLAPLRALTGPSFVEPGTVASFEYKTGAHRVRFDDGSTEAPLASLPRGALSLCSLQGNDPPKICFRWVDGAPGRVGVRGGDGPWLRLVSSGSPVTFGGDDCAAVARTRGQCTTIDDETSFFVTRALREDDWGRWEWATVFRPSAEVWKAVASRYGVSLEATGRLGAPGVDSGLFYPAALPKPCDQQAITDCGLIE